MAQPTIYDRQFNFRDIQTLAPADPLPGDKIDDEYNAVKQTLDEVLFNLKQIQRDDGDVANKTIGFEQLKEELSAFGFRPPTLWGTGLTYGINDTVFFGSKLYRALEGHVSSDFDLDLAAGKWIVMADFTAAMDDFTQATSAVAGFAAQAETSANDAAAAASAAALAEAGAAVAGDLYVDTAAGLADTVDQNYFFVKSNDNPQLADLYQNVGGVAVDQNTGIISTPGLWGYLATIVTGPIDANGDYAWIVGPGNRRVPVGSTAVQYDRLTGETRIGDFALKLMQAEDYPVLYGLGPGNVRDYVAIAPIRDTEEADLSVSAPNSHDSLYFTATEVAAADGVGKTEIARRLAQDMSVFPSFIQGYNGIGGEGQSYMAEDGTSGIFFDDNYVSRNSILSNGFSVGVDPRSFSDGAVYTPYGASLALEPLRERVVGPTNVDLVYPDVNVDAGNYPPNARTGDRFPLLSYVFQWLWQEHNRATGLDPLRHMIAMNKAKSEGSLAEILTGDGLARFKSMHTVMNDAVAAGANPGWAKQWMAYVMDHGEADEALGTAGYAASLRAAMDDLWTDATGKTGQALRPPWLMAQVASARGTSDMVVAQQQLDMSTDLTGTNAYAFLTAIKSEIPTLLDATMPVETNNDHPILSGKVLAALRGAISAHYILNRREPYFTPYVHKYYRDGDRALVVIPNMVAPLRPVELPLGGTMSKPAHWGFIDRNVAGADADDIVDIRVIKSAQTLIEIKFAGSKEGARYLAAGANSFAHQQTGQVFVRDSFDIDQPVTIKFDERMKRWHNALFGLGGDTGLGYLETSGAAGLNRGFVNQVPGYVDCKLDLGNPVARGIVIAEGLPV